MNEKNVKKSFYVTPELAKEWEDFHKPSKDFSPSGAAGMLLYLAADQPNLREKFRKLAIEKDMKKAIAKAKKLLMDSVLNAAILDEVENLQVKKSDLLNLLKQVAEQGGR